jgi:hypothetical protein
VHQKEENLSNWRTCVHQRLGLYYAPGATCTTFDHLKHVCLVLSPRGRSFTVQNDVAATPHRINPKQTRDATPAYTLTPNVGCQAHFGSGRKGAWGVPASWPVARYRRLDFDRLDPKAKDGRPAYPVGARPEFSIMFEGDPRLATQLMNHAPEAPEVREDSFLIGMGLSVLGMVMLVPAAVLAIVKYSKQARRSHNARTMMPKCGGKAAFD